MPPRKRVNVINNENSNPSIRQIKNEKTSSPFKPIDLNIIKTSPISSQKKLDLNNNIIKNESDTDLPELDLKFEAVKTEELEFKVIKRKQSEEFSLDPNDELLNPVQNKKTKKSKLVFSSDEEDAETEPVKNEDISIVTVSDEEEVVTQKRKRRVKYEESDSEEPVEPRYKLRQRRELKQIEKYDPSEEIRPKRVNKREIVNDNDDNEDELEVETLEALQKENDRLKRLNERKSFQNTLTEEQQFYLEIDAETNEKRLKVHDSIVSQMKPHQLEGIKFMWNCCFENLKRIENNMKGDGCILAHCMGLGKTLQLVALMHTLLENSELTKCNRILILLPVNVMLNWQNEIQKWTHYCSFKIPFYEISSNNGFGSKEKNKNRLDILNEWYNTGGVVLMGYQMFSNLIHGKHVKTSRQVERFKELLCKPGPDLIICDEGHVLKNSNAQLSKAVNQIQTRRRIVLTGTPLQNNLEEYYCMVSFVKPNLLGSKTEFNYRFVRPIYEGQTRDADIASVMRMKMRAHVLHDTLKGCVNRKDFSVIRSYLPPKNEYVLSIRLSELQIHLYRTYLAKIRRIKDACASNLGKIQAALLFNDFHVLSKIWTHPWLLREREYRDKLKGEKKKDKDFICDSEEDEDEDAPQKKGRKTKKENQVENLEYEEYDNQWYADLVTDECEYDLTLSGKLILFEQILDMCQKTGEKLVVFSQSLMSLDMIEKYLAQCTRRGKSCWNYNQDYYRIDGTVQIANRKEYLDAFNSLDNSRGRLFLISTKAGGVGINLVSANRCIIFDSTWNPCYDTQSIFRIYRLGQEKEVFVYRFLAQGTMEEKIYMRQVTKNALSQRVIDEHTLDRHFTKEQLRELYCFYPDIYDEKSAEAYSGLPKDEILRNLLLNNKKWIMKFHEHDSLLENRADEGLNEDERRAAWALYEAETKSFSKSDPSDLKLNQIEQANNNNNENNCVIS